MADNSLSVSAVPSASGDAAPNDSGLLWCRSTMNEAGEPAP
ncbi:hypothetical protein [Streptomyces sp. NPDC088762]